MTVTNEEDILERAREKAPDLLITYASLWDFEKIANNELGIRNYGRVAMFIDSDFLKNKVAIELAREGRLADVFFGERSAAMMLDFQQLTGYPYHVVANAADRCWHFPTAPVEKYRCDIAYVGAYLPKKKEQFQKLLLPLAKKYRVLIYGPYWTWRDCALLAGNRICRKLKLIQLGSWLNKQRITLPPEDENKLYSSAKICLNFHERGASGSDYDLLNGRTFKIPASGGFEICDNVRSLRQYFAVDEVVMAEHDDDWFRKVDYYMTRETEREAIRKKGTMRALRDHTYHNRVSQLLGIINSQMFDGWPRFDAS